MGNVPTILVEFRDRVYWTCGNNGKWLDRISETPLVPDKAVFFPRCQSYRLVVSRTFLDQHFEGHQKPMNRDISNWSSARPMPSLSAPVVAL